MMVDISRAYHAHSGNYTPGGNRCRYVVVHHTGNTASANAEARYAASNQHPSSYHYVLDGTGTVYQILDDTDTAWAVGAWSGARQLIGNGESISIEVCSNGTEFTGAEIEELRWLVHLLMERHGIDASHVVRHYDCHTGRKACPAFYTVQSRWDALRDAITTDEPDIEELLMDDFIYQVKGGSSQKWFDGSRIHPLATAHESESIRECYRYVMKRDMPMRVLSEKQAASFEAAVKRVM